MRRDSTRLVLIFGLMAAVLLVSTSIAYWFGLRALDASRTLIQYQSIIHTIDDTVSTLRDAETGQRGFLLTGDEQYLKPYHSALAHLEDDTKHLTKWEASGALVSHDRLDRLKAL